MLTGEMLFVKDPNVIRQRAATFLKGWGRAKRIADGELDRTQVIDGNCDGAGNCTLGDYMQRELKNTRPESVQTTIDNMKSNGAFKSSTGIVRGLSGEVLETYAGLDQVVANRGYENGIRYLLNQDL